MESNNWRPAQGETSSMEAPFTDWRSQLQPDARQRIVNKIMDTLKRHLPVVAPEGMGELKKIALRFEEKIYSAAVNQSDYLRKISLKMLSMETKTQQNTSMNSQPGVNQNSTDTGLLGGPPQVNNQGQPLSQIPMVSQPPGRQQILAQNMQNNTPSSMQGSSSLPATSSIAGLSQSTLTNYGHASNMQNMPGMSHSVNNSLAQGTTTDIYGNAQRQMQNRQQQQQSIFSQQQQLQQQSQNPLLYQNQLQPQLMKHKMHNNAHLQSIQLQQQQQSLLQANQLQSSQQSVMQMSSGQSSIQQSQTTTIQSAPQSSLQQNQLNSVQQPVTSLLPQHVQAISRSSQQPLSSVHHQNSLQQQSVTIHQQSNLQTQHQQQQLLGQQANMSNIQQNQFLGQQNNIVDIKPQQQQHRLPAQQNNLASMQQSQQLLNQQPISLHQQQQPQSQQQQLLGSLQNVSNMQPHQRSMQIVQQSKNMSQTQQQLQQPSMALVQPQGQQSHLSSQQQLMPQFQSQSELLQQQLAMQQQPNSIQREQQSLQLSGGLLQSQTAMEQQKSFMHSQRGIPEVSSSTSMDSTAQTGHSGADWKEEVYQKIQAVKEAHFADLQDFHLKISQRLQQLDIAPHAKQSENYEKLKNVKQILDRLVAFLQISKNNVTPFLKEKFPQYEKQLIDFLTSNRRPKEIPSQQQFPHPAAHSQSTPQRQPSQVMQSQQQDNIGNLAPQLNMSSAVPSSPQHGALTLSNLAAPAAQQNITNSVQSASDLDPVQVNLFSSLQQGSIGSVQQNGLPSLQNAVSTTQQTNLNNLSQNSMNPLQANNQSLQNSNVLQQQHLKQQQQEHLMQNQQLKQQLQQCQIQQQLLQQHQRQQLLQPQQLPQQQKQQQTSQMSVHQVSQHLSMNELNELKARQATGIRPGPYPQSYVGGHRHNYYHQQLKPGASFPISSPQNLQTSSPQISHNSSPQIDQHALLPILTKAGTPVQLTDSPFVVPSPSTPIAPSPIPGDSEKLVSSAPSHQTGGHTTLQQPLSGSTQVQANSVATPGISASPLLAEFTKEGNPPNLSTKLRESASEQTLERLIKAMQSVSSKSLSSAVSDITSVVSMIDRIAGSAPGNGSRAAVGEDLVAMTKCRLQARNFMSQDGGAAMKKMKRHTSAMPLNIVSSPGSINNFMKFSSLDSSEMGATATSSFKRQKTEVNQALQEEIREINRQLIDTVVSICDEDSDSVTATADSGEGIIVKCSYTAVALSPTLKAHFASMHLSPIAPLRLFVPANYPNSSPLLLDKLRHEPSMQFEDLHIKAKSRFSISLRCLSQPMSLREMAGTWDACARKVIVEYAQQTGGGSFSSTYGTWENCVGA